MSNNYTGKIVEFHILQSFPVSCLNRDDAGAPKSAVIGGVPRARVSSQCWKRQVRLAMHGLQESLGIHMGVRTKHVESLLADACKEAGANVEQAKKCAEEMAKVLTKDTLLFISSRECKAFAQYAQENKFNLSGVKGLVKDLAKVSKGVLNQGLDALDIALFGRMVAQAPDINVQAAASFAHAISTHKVVSEVDFFTALDDKPEEDAAGSAHMGILEFNSATYYRYVSLDLGLLAQTLGIADDKAAIGKAVEAFTRALFIAVPSARQNTQSAASPWEYAKVYVRHGQRLQASFDKPVLSRGGQGYAEPSIEQLESYLTSKEKLFGSMFGKEAEFIVGKEENYSIDSLVQDISGAL